MKEQSKPVNVGAPPNDQSLTTGVKVRNHPTSEQIRRRAHEIHKARGGNSHPVVDWFQAENELKAEMSCQQQADPEVRKKSPAAPR